MEKGNLEFVFLKSSSSLLSTALSQDNIASVVTALYDGNEVSLSITEQYDLTFVSNSVDAQYSLYSLALGTDAQLNYVDGCFYVGETRSNISLMGTSSDGDPLILCVEKGNVNFSGADKTYKPNSGSENQRAFLVKNGNLNINGIADESGNIKGRITLSGFSCTNGAGVLVENSGSTLTLDCNFQNCTASNSGGAVYCVGTLVINGGEYSNNTASSGGAVYCESATLFGASTTFKNNSASRGKDFYLYNENSLITLSSKLSSQCSVYKSNLKSFDDVYDRCTALGNDAATTNDKIKNPALFIGEENILKDSLPYCLCDNDRSINQGRLNYWQTLSGSNTPSSTFYIVYEWDTSLVGINPKNPTDEYSDESIVSRFTSGETFDGSTTYDVIGREYMFTDKITVNVWAYMDNWADYANGMRIYSCTESGGWNLEPNGGNIQFACYDAGVGYKSVNTGVAWSSLTSGWHMFTMTFDGEYVRAYIDGVNKGASAKYTSGKIGYNGSNSIIIGAEAGGGASPAGCHFKGKIQSFSIINDCFYASEIKNIYSQNNKNVIFVSKNRTEQHTFATDMPYIGYSFKEWTKSSGSGELKDNTFTFVTGVTIVVATYTVNTYKVTLDKQSGTGGTDAYYYQFGKTKTIDDVVCYYFSDENCEKPLNRGYFIECPTLRGYTFKGYFTEKNGAGTKYVSETGECVNNIYRTVADNTILYAYWTANTYEIIYKPNGGAFAEISEKATYGSDEAYIIIKSTDSRIVRTGYSFVGWTTKADGSDDKYGWTNWSGTWKYIDGQYGIADGKLILYARWEINNYTITYQTERETATGGTTKYTITDPIALATISCDGYTFGGWKVTKVNNTTTAGYAYGGWTVGATFTSGQTISAGKYGNVTLTAQWTVNSYTITFDGNGSEVQYAITWNYAGGGDYADKNSSYSSYSFDTTKAKRTLNYDSAFGVNSPVPVRRGYTFAGWYTEKSGGTLILKSGANAFEAGISGYTNANKQWIKAASATLYAHWTAKSYDISYELNGGTKGTSNPEKYTVESGVSVSDPTRTGYTFAGWTVVATLSQMNKAYINLASGYQHYESGYPNAVIYEPFRVSSGTQYTVPLGNGEIRWRSYNASTGAYAGSISSSSVFTPTAASNIAIWYHKGNSTSGATSTTITFAGGTSFNTATANITGHLTLKANWTANTHTVTFDSTTNDGDSMAVGKIPASTRVETDIKMDYSKSLVITGSFAMTADKTRHFVVGNFGGNSLQVEITNGNCLRLYCENATTTDTNGTKAMTAGVMYSYMLEYNPRTKIVTLTAFNGDGSTFETLTATIKDTTKISTNYFAVGAKDYRSGDCPFTAIILGTTTIISGSNAAYKIIPVDGGLSVNGTTKTITGYSGYSASSTKTVTYDSTYGALPAPSKSKAGYTVKFIGWFTAKTGGSQVTSSTKVTTDSNHTLFARWEETANIYKVTLDNQGATTAGTTEYYYRYNTKGANGEYFYTDVGLTTKLGNNSYTITVPKRNGYTFGGYYTETGGKGTQYINASGTCINNIWSKAYDNTTLYAYWTANEYTVKFYKNADDATGTMSNQTFSYGVAQQLNANQFKRTDYKFTGWNTKKDGTGKSYSDKQSVKYLTTAKNGTIELYAQWDEYTINLECYGEDSFHKIYIELDGKTYYGTNANIIYKPGTTITWHYDDINAKYTPEPKTDSLGTTTITVTRTYGAKVTVGDVEVDNSPFYNTASELSSKSGSITLSEDDDGKVITVCHVTKIYTVTEYNNLKKTTKLEYEYGEIPTIEGVEEEPEVYEWTLTWENNALKVEYGSQTVYTTSDTLKLYSDKACTKVATITTSFDGCEFNGYWTTVVGDGEQYITSAGKKTSAQKGGIVTLYARLQPVTINSVTVYIVTGKDASGDIEINHYKTVYSSASNSKTGYYVYYGWLSFNDNKRVSDIRIWILENQYDPDDITTADYTYETWYSGVCKQPQQITITDATGTTTYNSDNYMSYGWFIGKNITFTIIDNNITTTTSLSNVSIDRLASLESVENLAQSTAIVLDDGESVANTAQVWLDDKFRKLQEKQDTTVDFDGVTFDA